MWMMLCIKIKETLMPITTTQWPFVRLGLLIYSNCNHALIKLMIE